MTQLHVDESKEPHGVTSEITNHVAMACFLRPQSTLVTAGSHHASVPRTQAPPAPRLPVRSTPHNNPRGDASTTRAGDAKRTAAAPPPSLRRSRSFRTRPRLRRPPPRRCPSPLGLVVVLEEDAEDGRRAVADEAVQPVEPREDREGALSLIHRTERARCLSLTGQRGRVVFYLRGERTQFHVRHVLWVDPLPARRTERGQRWHVLSHFTVLEDVLSRRACALGGSLHPYEVTDRRPRAHAPARRTHTGSSTRAAASISSIGVWKLCAAAVRAAVGSGFSPSAVDRSRRARAHR